LLIRDQKNERMLKIATNSQGFVNLEKTIKSTILLSVCRKSTLRIYIKAGIFYSIFVVIYPNLGCFEQMTIKPSSIRLSSDV